jgi:tellurite resistance protein
VGLEPDVRFSGEVLEPDGKAVLFRTSEPLSAAPTASYAAAALLLRLGCVVAGADKSIGSAEEAFLAERVQSVLHLPPAEHARLRAHVRWLLASKVGTGGLKKRVAALDAANRSHVAEFVVGVAAADGPIEPGEVKSLQQVFTLLGLDPADVYGHIHRLGGSAAGSDGEKARAKPPHPLSAPTTSKPPREGEVTLDPKLVQARLAESEAVFGVLQDIFAASAEAAPLPVAPAVPGVWGLDAAHSGLVRALIARGSWSRGDYEDVARGLGLMPDGAIETVNEAAFEAVGEPLIEGEEDLTISVVLLEESVR